MLMNYGTSITDYNHIVTDLVPMICSSNDKRIRKNGVELTTCFIAHLKRSIANEDNNLSTYTHMLKDSAVLGSETVLLRMLDCMEKCDDNKPRTLVLNELWTLAYHDKLPLKIQQSFCQRFASYIIDQILLQQPEQSDTAPQRYTELIQTSRRLPDAFCAIIETIAGRMRHPDLRTTLQPPLMRFLDDIRSDMRPSDFRQLYPERMMPLVLLLSAFDQNCEPIETASVQPMLLEKQRSDSLQFVVLCTHFPRWMHLLEDKLIQ